MTPPQFGALATSIRAVDDLTAGLSDHGWHVAVVSGAPDQTEALDALGAALDFPGYYGRNLDALVDCLRDLERPTALVWAGWEPLAVQHPKAWAAIVEVLRARVDDQAAAPFSVIFSVQAPASA